MGPAGCVALTQAWRGVQGHTVCVWGGGGFIYTSSSVRDGKAALEGSEPSLGLGGTCHLCACAFAAGPAEPLHLWVCLVCSSLKLLQCVLGLGEKTSGVGGPWTLGYRVGGVIRRHWEVTGTGAQDHLGLGVGDWPKTPQAHSCQPQGATAAAGHLRQLGSQADKEPVGHRRELRVWDDGKNGIQSTGCAATGQEVANMPLGRYWCSLPGSQHGKCSRQLLSWNWITKMEKVELVSWLVNQEGRHMSFTGICMLARKKYGFTEI